MSSDLIPPDYREVSDRPGCSCNNCDHYSTKTSTLGDPEATTGKCFGPPLPPGRHYFYVDGKGICPVWKQLELEDDD